MIRLVAILCILMSTASLASAVETIIRGPYLQQATPTSVVVRWHTDAAVIGRVRYGTTLGSPTTTVTGSAATRSHSLTITGLTAGTRYYYDVGNSAGTVVASGPSYSFTAAPTRLDVPVRVWALGDSGTLSSGDKANQSAVREAFYAWNGGKRIDVTLLLGDICIDKGTDAEFQESFFDMYPESLRQTVFWPAIGNHDTYAGTTPLPYFSVFTIPTAGESGGVASGTENYYSFDHGPIHFVCLDSQLSSRSSSGAMATWLRNDLAATTKPWLIAFWHHSPYSKGSHDSDTDAKMTEMRSVFVRILEDHGVDLVLSGHTHVYERSYLLDGHYGVSSTLTPAMKKNAGNGRVGGDGAYIKADAAHQGAVYAVSGSAGTKRGGTLDHPAMVISVNELASFAFDVAGNRLDAFMIRHDGVIQDTFTIIQQAPDVPIVSITATDAAAGEPANHGTCRVSRIGSTDGNLTVNLTWSGTAARTADYTAPTNVVIPAGAASATITLTVIDDQVIEGDETAVAAIAASGSYTIGGPSAATVTIADNDATTTTISVAAGTDDAEEEVATGAMDLTSSDLELIRDGSTDQMVGLRFAGVAIPRHATIINATLQFTVDEATSATTSLVLRSEASDNAATFTTTTRNVSSRSRSQAQVAWNPPAWATVGSRGSEARTPDLAPLVQEVVSRAGWASGRAVAILVSGSGSRVANAKDKSSGIPASLRVLWTAAAPTVSDVQATPSASLPRAFNLVATAGDDGGEPALTYTWSTVSAPSGASVGFSPNGSHAAKSCVATCSHAGTYTLRVTVRDAGGLTASRDVGVTVALDAPVITTQPASQTRAVGQTATFTVAASGRPTPTYQWQRNGTDISGATAASYTTPALTAADHGAQYRCVATNSVGTAISNAATITMSGIGWQGGYYDNRDFTGTQVARTDLAIDFTWGTDAPMAGMGADTFSVRWRGMVTPAYSQAYTFTATCDDGVRVWVGGTRIIDRWTDSGAIATSGQVDLTAGVPVLVVMEYYENTGDASAKLAWQSASQAAQIIPHTAVVPATGEDLPGGWTAQDVGTVGLTGDTAETGGAWTLTGSGADIWNSADGFRFVWQRVSGDVRITAQVTSLTNTNPWSKAGVMVRESLAAGSRHAFTCVTPGNGVAFQRRLTADGASSHTAGISRQAPCWVRLERTGDVLIGSSSPDGTTWTEIRRVTIALGTTAHVGLALTSHDNAALAMAGFSNVQITAAGGAAN